MLCRACYFNIEMCLLLEIAIQSILAEFQTCTSTQTRHTGQEIVKLRLLIGVHLTILLALDPLSLSACLTVTHPHPIGNNNNYVRETLVARQQPTVALY